MPKSAADSVSLNKYISDTGFCSRREADGYIDKGRVTLNGKTARTGNRVGLGDLVEIDGEPVGKKRSAVYLAYNKPAGVTSTTDPKDQTNIVRAIDFKERIFPVGRLDKDSEGLIFLTNDGSIVNRILRAGNAHEKEYVVGVDQPVTPEFIRAMGSGVRIGQDETTLPCKIVQEGKHGFRITLVQGLNRQIRRMCTALGFEVTRLRRVRIMNMHLGNLPLGHWRYFNAEETMTLRRMIEGSSEAATAKAPKRSAAPPAGIDTEEYIDTEAPSGGRSGRTAAAPGKRTAPTAGQRDFKATTGEAPRSKAAAKKKTTTGRTAAKPAGKAERGGAKSAQKPKTTSAKPVAKASSSKGAGTAEKAPRRAPATPGSFKDFRNKRGKKG